MEYWLKGDGSQVVGGRARQEIQTVLVGLSLPVGPAEGESRSIRATLLLPTPDAQHIHKEGHDQPHRIRNLIKDIENVHQT